MNNPFKINMMKNKSCNLNGLYGFKNKHGLCQFDDKIENTPCQLYIIS